jgi:hypothetical protein
MKLTAVFMPSKETWLDWPRRERSTPQYSRCDNSEPSPNQLMQASRVTPVPRTPPHDGAFPTPQQARSSPRRTETADEFCG